MKKIFVCILLFFIAFITGCSDVKRASHRQVKPLKEECLFDSKNNAVSWTMPDGARTKYKFNAIGLLNEVCYPDSRVKYGYDADGNRITARYKNSAAEYYYDAFNRLAAVIYAQAPARLAVYDYDHKGRLSSLKIFKCSSIRQNPKYKKIDWQKLQELLQDFEERHLLEYEVKYQYDIFGNISSVNTNNASIKYFYSPEKGRIQRRLPNGITTTFTYSPCNLLNAIRHEDVQGQLIAEYQYAYNAAGKIVAVQELTSEGKKSIKYSWDERGYLKELCLPEGDKISYSYDSMGNRITKEDAGIALNYEYDEFGRLICAGNAEYEWDKNGNLIFEKDGRSKIRIKYDYRNLASLINTPKAIIRYKWDADGNMISMRLKGKITYYLSNPLAPSGFILAEFDNKNNLKNSYVYDGGLIGQQDPFGKMKYFLEDGFSSIRYVTDDSGKIIGRRDYTPFAEPVKIEGDSAGNFRMAGEKFLPEIKKCLIGNRLYDPLTGRYLSPDPDPGYLARFDSFNRYTHGDPKPTNFMEPRCIQTWKEKTDDYLLRDILRNLVRQTQDPYYIYLDRKMTSDIARLGSLYISAASFAVSPGWFDAVALATGGVREFCPQPAPRFLDELSTGLDAGGIFINMADQDWPGGISGIASFGLGNYGHNLLEGLKNPVISNSIYSVNQMNFNSLSSGFAEETKIIGNVNITKTYEYNPYLLDNWPKFGAPGPFDGTSRTRVISNFTVTTRSGNFSDAPVNGPTSSLKYIDKQNNIEKRKKLGKTDYPQKGPDWPDGGGSGGSSAFHSSSFQGFSDPFKSVENKLGGIELAATAEFVGDLGNIAGAVYDPEKQCVVLLGDKNLSGLAIKPEDLAIALLSVFGPNPCDPQFSLDPNDPQNPAGDWLKAVYIPEDLLGGTSFGKAMFEADWLLKQYSFGVKLGENGNLQKRISSVPGFKSTADLSLEEQGADYGKERWARFWIVADDVTLKEADNSIYFNRVKMRVKAKKIVPDPSAPSGLKDVETSDDPLALKFAGGFTDLYDEIAKESPEFERVKELAKAVGLAKWLKKEDIPVDMEWVYKYANKRTETVGKVTSLSVQWEKQSQNRYSEAGMEGIETSIQQLYLFGGVDLTVAPKYDTDYTAKARGLQEAVSFKLRQPGAGPIFTVKYNGKPLQALVLPITKAGQKMREDSPCMELDGVMYQFNNQKEVTKGMDRAGSTAEFSYGPEHKLKTVTVSNNNGYKIKGERNQDSSSSWSIVNPSGNTFNYRYGPSGYLNEIDVNGRLWAAYNIYEGELKQQKIIAKYDDGYIEKMAIDEAGNLKEYEVQMEKDGLLSTPKIEKITFSYDNSGNLTNIANVGKSLISIAYTEDGAMPATVSTPQAKIQYAYDLNGRVEKVTHSSGVSAEYIYDGKQLVKLEIDNQGSHAEYLFSENGITQSKDLLGAITNYGYIDGQLSSVKVAQCGEAKYSYDDQQRPAQLYFPDGSSVEYQYEKGMNQKEKSTGPQKLTLTILKHPQPSKIAGMTGKE